MDTAAQSRGWHILERGMMDGGGIAGDDSTHFRIRNFWKGSRGVGILYRLERDAVCAWYFVLFFSAWQERTSTV